MKVLAIAIATAVVVLSQLFLPGQVRAASASPKPAANGASNLTTSPITTDLLVKPGETRSTTLQIRNNGSTPISIGIQLKTFKANGSAGQASIINTPASDPSLSYVKFSKNIFTAEPGVFTPVEMTVSLPKDAELGYYYAVLFKPVLPSNAPVNTNTYTLSNAILVLVDSDSANEQRKLAIAGFSASKKVYEYLPASFDVKVRNDGNIYVPPRGVIFIGRDEAVTKPIASLELNKASGRVLPNSTRDYTLSWNDGFPRYEAQTVAGQPVLDKKNQPVMHLQYRFSDSDKFRYGKYYGRLALVYNNGQRDVPLYAVVSFWVIPWKLILIVLAVVLLQVLFVYALLRYRRLYRRSRVYSAKHHEE